MSRRIGLLAAVAGLAAATVGLQTPAPPAAAEPAAETLSMVAPRSLHAGEPLTVTVRGLPDGATAHLMATGALGFEEATGRAAAGAAHVQLVGPLTRQAGMVLLVASAGDSRAVARTTVVPSLPVGPVSAVVGARSIVADRQDQAMVVTTPLDAFGNAAADRTAVSWRWRRPAGQSSVVPGSVDHLLAWAELPSGTRAGTGTVSATVGAAAGPATTLDEVAGPPVSVTLRREDPGPLLADGQQLAAVATKVLRDRYGNVEPDGTLVELTWSGPGGRGQATAPTVAGVARFGVPTPTRPGVLRLRARCRGAATGKELRLRARPAVREIPARMLPTDDGLRIEVGPVLLVTGAYVADGVPVAIRVRGSGGESRATAVLRDGSATTTVLTPAGAGAPQARVEVLGVEATVAG